MRRLLDAGVPLRPIVRDSSTLPRDMRDHVEVVAGSHSDAAIVDQAFRGCRLVSPTSVSNASVWITQP